MAVPIVRRAQKQPSTFSSRAASQRCSPKMIPIHSIHIHTLKYFRPYVDTGVSIVYAILWCRDSFARSPSLPLLSQRTTPAGMAPTLVGILFFLGYPQLYTPSVFWASNAIESGYDRCRLIESTTRPIPKALSPALHGFLSVDAAGAPPTLASSAPNATSRKAELRCGPGSLVKILET